MNAYYNEHEPYAAQWLRNLAAAGHITNGRVDERDIQAVVAGDVDGFTRCHFFAGIAGWDYALQLAGWPADRPVWTASLPCQPFSAAGSRKGGEDDRHLWPVFYGLVRECRPATIFGEQVEAAIGHGWLDRVFADLESEGYACGAVSLPACSVGAPHIRSRVFWVADAERDRGHDRRRERGSGTEAVTGREAQERSGDLLEAEGHGHASRLEHATGEQARLSGRSREPRTASGMGHAASRGCEEPSQRNGQQEANSANWNSSRPDTNRPNAWTDSEFIPCADGKARRIESGTFPLATGISARVGKLRAYGNAIVPQAAAEFVKAFLYD